MSRLTQISLANRAVILMMSLIVVALGVFAMGGLKQELIPSIEPQRATIVSVFPGASPEAVEREVTRPVEDAVKAVTGVKAVTSRSASGSSLVRAEWEFGENSEKVQADIRAAAQSVSALPADVTPQVVTGGFDNVPVVVLAVSSSDSTVALSRKLKEVAAPRLKAIPGVRDVIVAGEEQREVVITLRPKDVDRLGVDTGTLQQVFSASGVSIPAGSLRTGAANLDVQVGRTLTSVEQIQQLRLQGEDGPVSLADVADVKDQLVETTSISRANGKPSLTLVVNKDQSGNTVTVSQGVRSALPGLAAKLGQGVVFTTVFDQAPFIEDSIHDLTVEGGLGLAFAVLVIMVFLTSVRPTIITAISIPLSLLIALVGLWAGGYTLNILTLGALTVAIGRVVDDSIVVIENIKRHQSLGRAGPAAIVRAVREVAGAITSSTLTTVAVFLPIGFVSGQAGALFRPFAVTVTIALLASLLVSLTVVPVLASWFMKPAARPDGAAVDPEHDDETTSPPTRLQRTYLPALRFALGHRVLTMALALLVFGGTLALAPRLKTDFIGNAGETSLRVTQELPSGTNLATTDAAAKKVETVLAGEAQVESYQTTVGGDPSQLLFGTATASNNASMSVTLKPGANGDQVRERLRREFATLTGVGAVEIGAVGSANQVVLYVESADSQKLRAGSDQVVAMLKRIGGVSNISSDLTDAKKQLSVQIDEQAAADAGMLQAQVGVAVSQAVKGSKIGTLESGGATVNVILRSRAAVATLAQLKALELPVSMKQSIDARKAAADRVEARQTAAQERQRADGVTAYQAQLDQIREGKKRAQAQSAELAKQLAALRARLAALNAAPAPPPGTPAPTPTTPDPRPALLAQIAELQKAIGAAQGQVRAADDSLAKAAESRQKQLGYQAEAEDIQQAAKDAQTTKATPLTLAEVAKVEEIAAPSSIGRVDGARAATITGLPSGSDLGSTTSNITRGIASLSLPEGVTVRVGGVSQAQQESFAQLGLAMLIAIAIVYLIMVATFGSLLQPLILLVSVPFAATGALGLLLATNTPLGVPAMIGLLMLIGIVVTNAIVLIDLINQYRRRGASIDDAIRQGARLRLRPIVMTALATVFALAPMGLGVTGGGIFISRPLAIVVIGGLVTSTVLTLVLVPVLYDVVEKLRSRGADRRAQRGQRPRGPVAAAADLD